MVSNCACPSQDSMQKLKVTLTMSCDISALPMNAVRGFSATIIPVAEGVFERILAAQCHEACLWVVLSW